MTKLIFDQTDGEKAQPMSIAKTNEDYNKKQPLPNDPDLGEHEPLVEIPNIKDEPIDTSSDNSIYPHSSFPLKNRAQINIPIAGTYMPPFMSNKLYDDNVFPDDINSPISNHFVSSIGNSNSRNEFNTEG